MGHSNLPSMTRDYGLFQKFKSESSLIRVTMATGTIMAPRRRDHGTKTIEGTYMRLNSITSLAVAA